jgi:hypothetical protein
MKTDPRHVGPRLSKSLSIVEGRGKKLNGQSSQDASQAKSYMLHVEEACPPPERWRFGMESLTKNQNKKASIADLGLLENFV